MDLPSAAKDWHEARTHLEARAGQLLDALERHDPGAREHAEATAAYGFATAAELGFPRWRCELVRLAGLVHDVGNLYVERELLQRPGRLTGEEYEQVRSHSDAGYRLLLGGGIPEQVAGWVLHHHERVDGNGYPLGLVGESIPVESRIVHAACALHALHSERRYRTANSLEAAVAELRAAAGTQFDEAVVDALLVAVERAGLAARCA